MGGQSGMSGCRRRRGVEASMRWQVLTFFVYDPGCQYGSSVFASPLQGHRGPLARGRPRVLAV